MQIKQINGQVAFCRKLVANCRIIDKSSKTKQDALLYELDTKNPEDRLFIEENNWYPDTVANFLRDSYTHRNYRTYNAVVDYKSGEIVGLSATTNHYKDASVETPGLSVSIDSISTKDSDYGSVEEILVAKSVNDALDRDYESVTAGTIDLDKMKLKRAGFRQAKNGDWVLPKRKMYDSIDSAQKKFGIEFLA